MRNPPPSARCLKVTDWPNADRELWLRTTSDRRRSFRGDNPAAKLSPKSITKTEEGYGRWLGALAFLGELVDELPSERITLERLESFLALLQQNGNRGYTIVGRFEELKRALELMYPGQKYLWVLEMGGFHIRDRVILEQRPLPVIDSLHWLGWADDLLSVAEMLPKDRARADLWQDALIVGLFGMRGMRLRTMCTIRIGDQLQALDGRFHLDFRETDIKTRSCLAYPIPAALNGPMRRFVEEERPRLLVGETHDHLWVGIDGAPLNASRIKTMIRTRSRHQFGIEFGPHAAKHSFTTSAIRRDPAHAGVASAILGTSARTLEKHYNHARSIEALDIHAETIRREREEAQELPRR